MDRKPAREWLIVYFKGLAMGCADAIPGVSGGTVALITGIYTRLIEAITSIRPAEVRKSFSETDSYDAGFLVDILQRMDAAFLAVLGAGILTALAGMLKLVDYLLVNFPVLTYGALTGLIAVSGLVLLREVDLSRHSSKLAALSGFLFAFMLSGYLATSITTNSLVIFFSGMVAVSALVLPGISGSLMLVILGQYAYMANAASVFIDAVIRAFSAGITASFYTAAKPVVVFVAGAFVGLFSVSHIVRKALELRRQVTMAFLVSLVLGGLRAPVTETGRIIAEKGLTWPTAAPEFLAAAVIGALIVVVFDRYAGLRIS